MTSKTSALFLSCFAFFAMTCACSSDDSEKAVASPVADDDDGDDYISGDDDDAGDDDDDTDAPDDDDDGPIFIFDENACDNGERIPVTINPIVEITALEKEDFWDFRTAFVDENSQFGIYPTAYSMSDPIRNQIYGGITWGVGWVEDTQFYIENPYVLAATGRPPYINAMEIYGSPELDFIDGCGFELKYSHEEAQKWMDWIFEEDLPFTGAAQLWFVNAADAGFNYASLSTDDCENVNPDWNSGFGGAFVDDVSPMPAFFYHYGHLDLNNLSPGDINARFEIIDREQPLYVRIKLWKRDPGDRFTTEDMRITLIVDPT